jgi:hypothetical protein
MVPIYLFVELEDMLDDDNSYVPTFNKSSRPPSSKGISRQ